MMTRLFVSLTLAGGIAVTGIAAADLPAVVASATADARTVAQHGTCRALDQAILAYAMDNGSEPTEITQLSAYATGDLSAYRIRAGRVTGPGCTD